MKNRCDALKRMYTQWKTLNLRASGLGRGPNTGCIVADQSWWDQQNAALPGCIMIKDAPLEHEDDLCIMFDSIIYTNESSFVPGATEGEGTSEGEGAIAGVDGVNGQAEEGDGAPKSSSNVQQHITGQRSAPDSPKGKKKKTLRDQYMRRFVEAYELKAQSSFATSPCGDPVRDEITQLMDLVVQGGAEEDSDGHFIIHNFFIKKRIVMSL
nr:uncharacterized protein LOC117849249 [Setaria viridis]